MSFSNLLAKDYWFSLYTDPLAGFFFWFILMIYVVAIVVGALAGRQAIRSDNKDKNLQLGLQKISSFGYSFGLVGLLFFFFRQQYIQFFGMRIWQSAWWLAGLIWLGFIVWFFVKEIPKRKRERLKRQEFQKYL